MPSFRISLSIGALRPGVDPATVLPTAVAAAESLAVVEGSGLDIVRGAPRIVVRFETDAHDLAVQIGSHVGATVAEIADVPVATVTERVGNRWHVVRADPFG